MVSEKWQNQIPKKVKWKDKRIASDVDLNVMSLDDKQDEYMESK
jgi:hypothetical protein